jgi:hypothetical protein
MDQFLTTLRGDAETDEGEFTLAAERAKELLKDKALTDVWQAWLCLVQGFQALGTQRLDISFNRQQVTFQAKLVEPLKLSQVMANDRMLLGWLNSDWFGKPDWNQSDSTLRVILSGSVWTRYNHTRVLKNLLVKSLAYCDLQVTLNGSSLTKLWMDPKRKYTLYGNHECKSALTLPFDFSKLDEKKKKLLDCSEEPPSKFAAIAFKTNRSWSQATWVSQGVVIKEERNTLERPGLAVVGSVESIGLKTDLSGFEIVHDESYMLFVNRLKKDALWML